MLYQASQDTFIMSMVLYPIVVLINMGITLFFMNWGDKIQVVEYRRLIFSISILPGFIFISFAFLSATFADFIVFFVYIANLFGYEDFSSQFIIILIQSLIISLIFGIIIKQISYRTVPF